MNMKQSNASYKYSTCSNNDKPNVNVNLNLNLSFQAAENSSETLQSKRTPRRTLKTELIRFKEDEYLGDLEKEGDFQSKQVSEFYKRDYTEEVTVVHESPISQIHSKGSLKANSEENFDYENYFKIKKIEDYPDLVKTVDLEFLAQCGNKLKEMDDNLEKMQSPYQEIRLYTDFAQDQKFSYLADMFEYEQASTLFSKIVKIERWSVILLFYFCVRAEEYDSFLKEKRLSAKLHELIKEVFRNHNLLVNWVKMVNKRYNVGWILNDNNMIYSDVAFDIVRLIIEVKSCCRVITGIINHM